MRGRAQQVALRAVVDLALDQLVHQRRDLGDRRAAVSARNSRRNAAVCRPASRFQFGELAERLARLALLQRHLGLEHEPRHREARYARIRRASSASRASNSRMSTAARAPISAGSPDDCGMASASSANWRALP